MKKRGLGQGLSSLLGAEALAKTSSQEGLKEVYTSQLVPSQNQPRRVFDEGEIEALGQSIHQNGLLQPILVRKISDQAYEIVAGERRWRAAKKIGLDRLPVLVREMSDEEVMTVALVENLQRENLNALEEAHGYDRIIKKMNITQEELAKLVGKSRSHITNMCRLLQLPEKIQNLVETGELSAGHAKILVGVEEGEKLADLIMQKKMSVRQAEKLVQKTKGKESIGDIKLVSSKSFVPFSHGLENHIDVADLSSEEKEEISRIESFLQERIGYKVNICVKNDNSTQVVFHLSSRETLDDLLAKLNTITS
jgi:ParB family chromosome partitioning protein